MDHNALTTHKPLLIRWLWQEGKTLNQWGRGSLSALCETYRAVRGFSWILEHHKLKHLVSYGPPQVEELPLESFVEDVAKRKKIYYESYSKHIVSSTLPLGVVEGQVGAYRIFPLVQAHTAYEGVEFAWTRPLSEDQYAQLPNDLESFVPYFSTAVHCIESFLAQQQEQNALLRQRESQIQEVQPAQAALQNLNQTFKVCQRKQMQETLQRLQETQQQLTTSEKLAALGQRVAGSAYEINSRAIKGYMENLVEILPRFLGKGLVYMRHLSQEKWDLLQKLIVYLLSSEQPLLASKQEFAFYKEYTQILEAHSVPEEVDTARLQIEAGMHGDTQPWIPLFDDLQLVQQIYYVGQLKAALENSLVAAGRACKIVYALKSYAHTGDTAQLTHLPESIETVLMLYYHQIKQGITLHTDYEPNLPLLYSDEIAQVWTNILQSPIQAMQGEGELQAEKLDSHVAVHFTDAGPDIFQERLSRIFEPFFPTKVKGEDIGLGLDTYKRIVETHGGCIKVQSRPGRTVFSIFLPLTYKAPWQKHEMVTESF